MRDEFEERETAVEVIGEGTTTEGKGDDTVPEGRGDEGSYSQINQKWDRTLQVSPLLIPFNRSDMLGNSYCQHVNQSKPHPYRPVREDGFPHGVQQPLLSE